MDADTFIGIRRLMGLSLPTGIDFYIMEAIDLNGSMAAEPFSPTLLYALGVDEAARRLKFPRPEEAEEDEPLEVTELVERLLRLSPVEIVAFGAYAQHRSEETYRRCLAGRMGHPKPTVGFWVVGEDDGILDPSRSYRDGFEVVVVYWSHRQSVSIHCFSGSRGFGGQKLAGVQFTGNSKVCKSPRGLALTESEAELVFRAAAVIMGAQPAPVSKFLFD